MQTIALLSRKGGAGKSSLAVNLAVAALKDGKAVAILDIDPQASSADWGDSREDEDPAVFSVVPARLNKALATAERAGADLAIIDTAPHSESSAIAAARAADFILIPAKPSIIDLRAIAQTVELIRIAQKPAGIVVNMAQSESLAIDAQKAVKGYQLPIAPKSLRHRVAWVHSFNEGQGVTEYEPHGKAAAELQRLYSWTIQQLNS